MRTDDDLHVWAPLLYVPADRPGLRGILSGDRNLGVCCLAICLEDAVRPANRAAAASELSSALQESHRLPRPVFVRPASVDMLDYLLETPGVDRLAGFIIPKATVSTITTWVERTCGLFRLLPILESREALDPIGRRDLAETCAAHRPLIPAARIGANDLFCLLGGLRRPEGRTIYETPVGFVIDSLIEAFCARGVGLCGPVFDRIDDFVTLKKEVEDDVSRGLYAKTAITPAQVDHIWTGYMPSAREVIEAQRILETDAPAVFSIHGTMLEPSCHSEWARRLMVRSLIHTRWPSIDNQES